MKTIADTIAALVARANPQYTFFHEVADIMNIKLDALNKDQPFVWVDAIRKGSFKRNKYAGRTQQWTVDIYFCRMTYFGSDTRANPMPGGRYRSNGAKNEEVVEQIKEEVVMPFLDLLDDTQVRKELNLGEEWGDIPASIPPSRFDGNELSVLISLTINQQLCK